MLNVWPDTAIILGKGTRVACAADTPPPLNPPVLRPLAVE